LVHACTGKKPIPEDAVMANIGRHAVYADPLSPLAGHDTIQDAPLKTGDKVYDGWEPVGDAPGRGPRGTYW
jgi:hypothetical protein